MLFTNDSNPGIFDQPSRQQAVNIIRKDQIQVANSESRSLSFRWARYLIQSGIDDVIQLTSVFLSFVMVLLYAVQTYYEPPIPTAIVILQLLITCIFLIDYLNRFFTSEKRLGFFFSLNSLLSLIIMVPTFIFRIGIMNEPTQYPARGLVLIKVLYMFGLFRMEKFFARRGKQAYRKFWKMAVSLFSIMIIFAAFIQACQNYGSSVIFDDSGQQLFPWFQFHVALYFLIITMVTVGFGDIYPTTTLGRLCIIAVILILISVLPVQFQQYIKAKSLTSRFARIQYVKPKKTKHILVLGDFSQSALETFLRQLYHADHGLTQTQTVILLPRQPDQYLTNNISKNYKGKVFLLGGSAFDRRDLKRCLAEQSACIVILAKKLCSPSLQQDYRNIMLAMAVKKYGFIHMRDLRVSVQLIRPQHKHLYNPGTRSQSTGKYDQVVCIDQIKLHLLAKSCTCQGIITLISLLITSDVPQSDGYQGWQRQYLRGAENQIYRVSIHGIAFEGQRFKDVVQQLYSRNKIILVALQLKIGRENKVFVNPYDYIFQNQEYNIYVIYKNHPNKQQIYGDQIELVYMAMSDAGRSNYKSKVGGGAEGAGSGGGALTGGTLGGISGVSGNDGRAKNDQYFQFTNDIFTQKLIKLNDKKGVNDTKNDNIVRLNKPTDYNDAIIHNCNGFEKHVILCNIFPGIENFIATLRSKSLGSSRPPIVVLSNQLQPSVWSQINTFQDVFIMKGNALNASDLQNCGLSRARAIVVLSRSSQSVLNVQEEFLDADAIFMYKTIRNANKNVLIITEFNNVSTISFIHQRSSIIQSRDFWYRKNMFGKSRNSASSATPVSSKKLLSISEIDQQSSTPQGSGERQRNSHILNPPFAAGEIYFSQLLDTIMCQAYYNPFITQLLRQFVVGPAPCNQAMAKVFKRLNLTQSSLHLIPVPYVKDQFSWKFKELFLRCIQNRVILIGIFKHGSKAPSIMTGEKRSGDQIRQYVIINPKETYEVYQTDKLYVLSDCKPQQLERLSLDSEKRLQNYKKTQNDLANQNKKRRFKPQQGPQGFIDQKNSEKLRCMLEKLQYIDITIKEMKKQIERRTSTARDMLSHKLNIMSQTSSLKRQNKKI